MREEALFKFDEVIKVEDKQFYLTDILKDDHYYKWFNNVKGGKGKIFILNKGRCGNGGTTGFINYARENCKGLIVSVPNRSIVISKEKLDECCCVYGGAENIDKNKNIRICTWDKTNEVEGYDQFGFENIDINDLEEDWSRFWAGSLLVVDEYHKLIDDSNYREVCSKITKTILTTNSNVVLMSATPNYKFIEFLRESSGKDVETYNVQYDDEYMHQNPCKLQWFERKEGYRTYDMVCDQCEKSRKRKEEYKQCPSKIGLGANKLALFFNSVKDICGIVNQMPDELKTDIEVLCSRTEAHESDVPCYSKNYNPEKQIHFMTKAYITGMDIFDCFWRVIFIGGNDIHYLAFSNKEVKQGLGRFREGYVTTAFVTNGKVKNKYMYAHMKSMIGTLEERIQKRKKYVGDVEYVKDHIDEIVQENLDFLYYTSTVESMDGWDDFESFEKMMSEYPEYLLAKSPMPKPKRYPRARDISFKEYKQNRLKGIKVAYKYAAICERFIEKYGLERFEKATRNEIESKVKLDGRVGDVEIDTMRPEEKYEFLLGDGLYKGSYLMSVLDYLGQKCDYEKLEETMMDAFGCFCVMDKGDKSKLRSCWFLCVLGKMVENPQKRGHASIYKSVSPILGKNHLSSIKVSKKISKRNKATEAITDYLDSTQLYSMINGGDYKFQEELYTKIFKDVSVLPNLKRDEQYKKILDECKKNQTMISEFYKDTSSKSVKYPHKTEEMEKIDCLIVDIDDSITYNDFKKIYSDKEWTAYPSISNSDPDNWNKFRVIIPIAQTLLIPNDSLNVLKLLRRMVCKYEDKNHQLGSYVKQEQWEMRRSNEGEVVDISQDTVTYLHTLLQNLVTVTGKFRKSKKDDVVVNIPEVTNAAIERAVKMITEAKEGNRHATIYRQMWKLMTIYRISDEQIDYIREQITDYEKVKEFNEQVKYIRKRYMR